jgi:hypothetical protein
LQGPDRIGLVGADGRKLIVASAMASVKAARPKSVSCLEPPILMILIKKYSAAEGMFLLLFFSALTYPPL